MFSRGSFFRRFASFGMIVLVASACDLGFDLPTQNSDLPPACSIERVARGSIHDLARAADGTLFSAGKYGAYQQKNGVWQVLEPAIDGSYFEILPLGHSEFLAVGEDFWDRGWLHHWRRGDLNRELEGLAGRLETIWGTAQDGFWAAGGAGVIYHGRPGTWRKSASFPGVEILDLDAVNRSGIVACGTDGFLARRGEEGWVCIEQDLTSEDFGGVCATAIDEFYMISNDGGFYRLRGEDLEVLPPVSNWYFTVSDLWGTADDLFTIGDVIEPSFSMHIKHWDGQAWQSINEHRSNFMFSGETDSAGDLHFGGWYGSRACHEQDSWTLDAFAPGRRLNAVAERDGTWWAAGSYAITLRKGPGESWEQLESYRRSLLLIDLTIHPDGTPYAIAYYYQDEDIVKRWDHEGWSTEWQAGLAHQHWYGIWCDGEGDLWLAGSGGILARRVDGVWELIDTGLDVAFLEGSWENGLHSVVGEDGMILTGDGESWSHRQVPEVWSFQSAARSPTGTLYAAGNPGILWRDRQGGEILFWDEELYPHEIAFTPGGALWVAGNEGLLMHWIEGQLEPLMVDVTRRNLLDLAVDRDGAMYAVGRGGIVVGSAAEIPTGGAK